MSCCAVDTAGTDKFFSRLAKRYARQFRKKGLDKCQKLLAEGISQSGLESKRILEIGCGVGGLHLTLLRQGAGKAVGVEVSQGMLEYAQKFAVDMGLENRVRYRLGDFVAMAHDGSEASGNSFSNFDITILDKVVCCYEDWRTLVSESLGKTKEIYAISHPRPFWYIRLLFSIGIFVAKLLRWKFHPFSHDWASVQRKIEESGFRKNYESHTPIWLVLVYQKV